MSATKKPRFVWNVVLKSYHSWNHRSGPDDVGVDTFTYATEELANNSLPELMLNRIIDLLIDNDWETTSSSNYDFDEKHGKWWPTFVKQLEKSYDNGEDTVTVAKQWFSEHNLVVNEVYLDFMKRCEYAPRLEDISIQRATIVYE